MAKELPSDSQEAAESLIAANSIINSFRPDDLSYEFHFSNINI